MDSEKKIEIKDNKSTLTLPCVAMRDLVVFPNMVIHFDVARERTLNSIRNAFANDRRVFLTAQKDVFVEEPTASDVYKIGVVAEIKQIIKNGEGVSRIRVEGLFKAKLVNMYAVNNNALECEVKRLPNYSKEKINENGLIGICREVKEQFNEYAALMPRMPKELITSILAATSAQKLFESAVFNIPLMMEDKQNMLEAPTAGEKLSQLIAVLAKETQIVAVEKAVHDKVAQQIDRSQREHYLREQLRAIQSELGEGDEAFESGDFGERIMKLNLAPEYTDKLIAELNRLNRMPSASQEAALISEYLETCLSLPWNTKTRETANVNKAKAVLDRDHYGMKRVKDRILETIAVRELAPEVKGQILCLVGPPGVGKTSIGKSVAAALGRKYVRVSLGGVKDEADIRGHRKTYVGAMPGRIIDALKRCKVKNPLILLDEIDKLSNDFHGDPSSALLEALDSEQNSQFRDHYIEIPFDLSEVMFITTANTLDTIQPPLLDRMEVIELPSYTREEKFNIAKKHLIPKQLKKNGLKAAQMKVNDDAVYAVIDSYTREAGVRKLERAIASLCRKAAAEIVTDGVKKVTFKASNLEKYLGLKKYLPDVFSDKNEIGVVNGLAWTSVGGVLMPLEVLVLEGKGNIELTGSLGDVMKESAKIAVSYCRSVSKQFDIQSDFYKTKDIHIHAPEGAVPKDGPSAGVTLVTALVSALAGIPVRSDVAMTGEITLTGRVLAIGGLREKTMAAYKEGIKTVIVPLANKSDLDEIDETVKSGVEFVFADKISDVLNVALVKNDSKPPFNTEIFDDTRAKTSNVQSAVVN